MGGKLKASLLLAAMFGLGVITGLAWEAYHFRHRMPHPIFEAHRLYRLKKELHLNPEQEAAIRKIFEKAHERARQVNEEVAWDLSEIRHDSVQAIRDVLTPEQQQRFDQMHRHMHHAHPSPMMGDTPPPPPPENEPAETPHS